MRNHIGRTTSTVIFSLVWISAVHGQAPPPNEKAQPKQPVDRAIGEDGVPEGLSGGNLTRFYVGQYERALQSELLRAEQLFDLQEDDVEAFTSELRAKFDVMAQEASETHPGELALAALNATAEIEGLTASTLARLLSPDQADQYREDVRGRAALTRKTTLTTVVMGLDVCLALTPQQIVATEKVLNEHVDRSWDMLASRHSDFPNYLKANVVAALGEILTEKQREAYSDVSKKTFGSLSIPAPDDAKVNGPGFVKELQICVDARLEAIGRISNLDDKQKKKLQILSRGVMTEVLERRSAMRLKLSLAAERGGNGTIDSGALNYATAPAATLFLSHEQWLAYVESVLNEQQRPAFRAARDSRIERKRRYLAGTLANGMSQQFGLSAPQTSALVQLVLTHFPSRDASLLLRFELFEAITALPLDEVSKVIGEENMAAWKQQLAAVEKFWKASRARKETERQ